MGAFLAPYRGIGFFIMEIDFKCKACKTIKTEKIETADITKNKGLVDQKKLKERIDEPRMCCNQKMVRLFGNNELIGMFPNGKGAISQRFA